MFRMGIADIAKMLGCEYNGENYTIKNISSDSRNVYKGTLFIALEGENFDGHDYVNKAFENGASAAVVMKDVENPKKAVLKVNNTRDALLNIAGTHRQSCNVKVAAVTGSVGKTTTKEMTACVCSAKYNTHKTAMNLNNEVGVSQMLLGIESYHEVAVLEMGMDGPGQIKKLSDAAKPDIAVITNIGSSHMEAFGSREGIMREKLSVLSGLSEEGAIVLNADDDCLKTFGNDNFDILTYGIKNKSAQVVAGKINEFATHTNFEINFRGEVFDAQIPTMGTHNVYNALAGFCVGILMGISPVSATAALRGYRPVGMRQNVVRHNDYTIVEDCYNASPDSMAAAMRTLSNIVCTGKRIAVLSDMLELGKTEEEAHLEAGRLIAELNIDYLLTTGELSELYIRGANEKGMVDAIDFASKEELYTFLKTIIQPDDVVWFKASRSMKLEDVINRIYEEK